MLQAGQSSVTLEGGDITFACPGYFTVKGGQHFSDSGARMVPEIETLPSGSQAFLALTNDIFGFDEQFHLVASDGITPRQGDVTLSLRRRESVGRE